MMSSSATPKPTSLAVGVNARNPDCEAPASKRLRSEDSAPPAAASTSPCQQLQSPPVDNTLKPRTQLVAAAAEDKGTREKMEDVWVVEPNMEPNSAVRIGFFGVFDGHGGSSCAQAAAKTLHANVAKAGLLTVATASHESGKLDVKGAKQAVMEGFKATDAEILKQCAEKQWPDGACAVAVWLVGESVLVANVGDAKCVLARVSDKEDSKGQMKALTLTKEHRAIIPSERARIQKAGGSVSADGRLSGRIQVSRAFGDMQFKKSGSSAVPDVTVFELTERDDFLICACDGFWGVFGAQDAVDAFHRALHEGRDEKGAANRVLHEAMRERRCLDNCTVLLVRFRRHKADQP